MTKPVCIMRNLACKSDLGFARHKLSIAKLCGSDLAKTPPHLLRLLAVEVIPWIGRMQILWPEL